MMPRFKVQANDGKVLTIEAADEAGVDEAMKDYHSSIPKPETGIESMDRFMGEQGKQVLSNLGSSANEALNYTPVGSVREIAGQLNADRPNSPWRAGLAAADLALTGGMAGMGIKTGIGLGKAAGQALIPGFAANMGTGAAVEGAQALGVENPLALGALGLAGGLASGHFASPKLPPNTIEPLIAKLESLGAKPTAAMRSPGAMSQGMEMSARTSPYPWIANKIATADESMADAARKLAQESFGPDILQPRGESAGKTLQGALGKMAESRAESYAPALEQLKTAKGFPGFKKSILDSVDAASQDTGNLSALAFKRALAAELKGKNSPAQIDKALTHVKISFQKELGNVPMKGQLEHDFGMMMDAAKEAHYQGLNNISGSLDATGQPIKGNLGDMLREAKGDYREATEAMTPMAKILHGRSKKPESMGLGILNQGSTAVKDLLNNASAELKPQIQSELAKSIIAQSIGKEGGISGPALKTALNKTYREVVPLLGKEGNKLQELANALERGKIAELRTVNPSGSAMTAAKIAETSSIPAAVTGAFMGHPGPLMALGGKALMDTAYSSAGVPLQRTAQAVGRVVGPQIKEVAKAGIRKAAFGQLPFFSNKKEKK